MSGKRSKGRSTNDSINTYSTSPRLCKSAIGLIVFAIIFFIVAVITIFTSIATLNPETAVGGTIGGVVLIALSYFSIIVAFIVSLVGLFTTGYHKCFIITAVISGIILLINIITSSVKDSGGKSLSNIVANNINKN